MKKTTYACLRQRGFTLMELAIVMSVIGAIIGAIWWASSNTSELQKENSALTEVQTVAQNMSNLYAGRSLVKIFGAAGTNITSGLIAAQAIPAAYVNSVTPTTTADTPWAAGKFVVTNTAAGFHIALTNVTAQGCAALLLGNTACQWGQLGCPIKVYTNGEAAADSLAPATGAQWPTVMNSTEAAKLCMDNGYTGGTNSVEFDYSL